MRRISTVWAVAAACLVGAMACGNPGNPVEPGEVASAAAERSSPAVAGPQAAPSGSGGPAVVNSGLAAIRNATAAFHDVRKAEEAGYVVPPGCDFSPAGVMGAHAANQALVADLGVDPLKPEVLLYLPRPEGGFKLVGVEYLVPVIVRNATTGETRPWFDQARWSADWVIVNQRPSLLGQPFDGEMPGHVPGMPWHWDLHVWLWAPNPSGTFAQWNPSLSCPQ